MGHHCRADDGGFLGFYEDDGFVRVLGQEVFFEEFDGVFRIDDDLSASLLDGWGKEGFRVALLLCPSAALSLKMPFLRTNTNNIRLCPQISCVLRTN